MGLLRCEPDVFLLADGALAGHCVRLNEVRQVGDLPVRCEFHLHSNDGAVAELELTWNPLSSARRSRGETVDCTLTIHRDGMRPEGDIIDMVFPLHPADISDPVFAAIAAAAFATRTPERLRAAELFVATAAGVAALSPFSISAHAHAVTGCTFATQPKEARLVLRLHLAAQTEAAPLQIRVSRVFCGTDYAPYVYNPTLELAAHLAPVRPPPNFAEIAAEFVAQARALSTRHQFTAGQNFVKPFHIHFGDGPGFEFLVGTLNSVLWYAHGREQHLDDPFYDGLVEPGDVLFDCGAHAGLISIYQAIKTGPHGKVFAFEPFPQNSLQIEAQARLNGLSNLISVRAGVGERRERLSVSNMHQQTVAGAPTTDALTIEVHRLDDYLDARPNAIKLDIEGAEISALRGGQRMLNEQRPRIVCEFHTHAVGQFGHSLDDFLAAIPHDKYAVDCIECGNPLGWQRHAQGTPLHWQQPGYIRAWPR